jgi:probable HAF family extracellular repeat protein
MKIIITMCKLASVLAFTALSFPTQPPNVIPGYRITILRPPHSIRSFATGINNRGDVVGYFFTDHDFSPHGYLYSGGFYSQIDAPGTDAVTYPNAINNDGLIVGDYFDVFHKHHGFTLKNGKFKKFDVRNPKPGIYAFASVNDHGVVAGTYKDMHGNQDGFIVPLSHMDKLVMPHILNSCKPYAINNKGDVIGICMPADVRDNFRYSFIYHAGQLTKISRPNATLTYLTGINDRGEAVGIDRFKEGTRWMAGSCLYDNEKYLDITDPPGWQFRATRINDKGQIVGSNISYSRLGPTSVSILLTPVSQK